MTAFDPSTEMVVITLVSAIFGAAATVIGGFFRASHWLNTRFEQLRISLESLLDRHEFKDQERHEENIQRFSRIETVIKNGH